MKVSFCTTCMGRLHHLMETLPRNLADNPDTDNVQVEFVVLNYNSQDGLHGWMMSDPLMQEEMQKGRIRYAVTTEPEKFHPSHAKNMAHRLATGDVVCNLDADNFTGPEFAKAIAELFEQDSNVILVPSGELFQFCNHNESGFWGRITLSRDNFYLLGGYREDFQGWGKEDDDLVMRARLKGIKRLEFDNVRFIDIITHGHNERVENMGLSSEAKDKQISEIVSVYESGQSLLRKISVRFGSLTHPSTSNGGTHFGLGQVRLGAEQVIHQITPVKGTHLTVFNEAVFTRWPLGYFAGLGELVHKRLSGPRVISLVDRGAQPS